MVVDTFSPDDEGDDTEEEGEDVAVVVEVVVVVEEGRRGAAGFSCWCILRAYRKESQNCSKGVVIDTTLAHDDGRRRRSSLWGKKFKTNPRVVQSLSEGD